MSDYIKREDAIFIALQQPFYSLIAEIKQLDGIDIVRCKECKWQTKDQYDEPYCGFHSIGIYADDYCSYGEREGE